MLQKPIISNISKTKKATKRKFPCRTPPEVSKLLNTIGLDSSSSFINSRSSSSSKHKSSFSSKSSNTEPKDTSTPNSSPERAIVEPKSKKARIERVQIQSEHRLV
jgi:hypothetical protein